MEDNRKHSSGKGDKPRPMDYKQWSDNWNRIFKQKSKKAKKKSSKK